MLVYRSVTIVRCGFSTCLIFSRVFFHFRQLFHEVQFFWAMAHLENRLNLYSSDFNGIFHALKQTAKATQKIGKKKQKQKFHHFILKKNICSRSLSGKVAVTLLEPNIAPENKQSQKGNEYSNHPFSGAFTVSFRECRF